MFLVCLLDGTHATYTSYESHRTPTEIRGTSFIANPCRRRKISAEHQSLEPENVR